MKKLLSFLTYLPVILVGVLGAYIVFHMWQLTEIGRSAASRKKELPGKHASAQTSEAGLASAGAKESPNTGTISSADQH
jgi:hypothetical protein